MNLLIICQTKEIENPLLYVTRSEDKRYPSLDFPPFTLSKPLSPSPCQNKLWMLPARKVKNLHPPHRRVHDLKPVLNQVKMMRIMMTKMKTMTMKEALWPDRSKFSKAYLIKLRRAKNDSTNRNADVWDHK